MSSVRTVKIKCPKCGEEEEFLLTEEFLSRIADTASGVQSIAKNHKDHVLIAYFDKFGGVRGVEAVETMGEDLGPLPSRFIYIPIPKSRSENIPSLDSLSLLELRILALCYGTRSLREIAQTLGMKFSEVKLIAENLLVRRYLREIKTKINI